MVTDYVFELIQNYVNYSQISIHFILLSYILKYLFIKSKNLYKSYAIYKTINVF